MSDTKTIKNPSPLVLAVLELDQHYADFKRLASRIEEIELKSNFDFDQSQKLMAHFAETGEAINTSIQKFVQILAEARVDSEKAASMVAAKAEQIRNRKGDVQDKMARFQALSEKVTQLNESLLGFKRNEGESLSDADKENLKESLSRVAAQLDPLVAEAEELKRIGYESKIKTLEQNADSLRQALIAVGKKISSTVVAQ